MPYQLCAHVGMIGPSRDLNWKPEKWNPKAGRWTNVSRIITLNINKSILYRIPMFPFHNPTHDSHVIALCFKFFKTNIGKGEVCPSPFKISYCMRIPNIILYWFFRFPFLGLCFLNYASFILIWCMRRLRQTTFFSQSCTIIQWPYQRKIDHDLIVIYCLNYLVTP